MKFHLHLKWIQPLRKAVIDFLRTIFLLDLAPNERTAGYAFYVSLISILLTIRQINLQAQTAKDSVRPLISIHRVDDGVYGFRVVNEGIGPAIVFDAFYLFKGKRVDLGNSIFDIADSIKQRFWVLDDSLHWEKIEIQDIYRPGVDHWLLKVSEKCIDRNKFLLFADSLNLLVRYRSICHDTFVSCYSTKNLPNEYSKLNFD